MDADELRLGQFEGQINIVCSFVVVLMLFLCIFLFYFFATVPSGRDHCHQGGQLPLGRRLVETK